MGHSIGDGLIVAALAVPFVGYLYFKHQERLRRLEIIHAERLAAMDKGIPLPELPLDPPATVKGPPRPEVPLILGIFLASFGVGTMIALAIAAEPKHWAFPLPIALMGVGLLLYYFLSNDTARRGPSTHGR
jgi:hypothetical protein